MNERRIKSLSISDVLWIAVGLIVLLGLGAAVARDDAPDRTNETRDPAANAAIASTQRAEAARLEHARQVARYKEDQRRQQTVNTGATATDSSQLSLDRNGTDVFPTAGSATPTAADLDPNSPEMVILGHPAPNTTTLNMDRDGSDVP